MISERVTDQGLTFLDVETPFCAASLCLQGAHLVSWKPAGQQECLFLSPKAVFSRGKAIRGGIPVCWPWFGVAENGPAHGIARTSEWRLHHQETDMRGNLLLSLALYPDDAGQPAAILRLTLGSSLAMKLETTVRRLPCKLTEAFHNYFAVGNLTKCRVLGLENVPFREYAAQPIKHGERPLAPLGCLDRVYDCPDHTGKNYSGRSGHEPFHHGGAGACLFRHRLEPWPAGCGGHAGPGSGFLGTIFFAWKRGMPHPGPFILLQGSPIPCARKFQWRPWLDQTISGNCVRKACRIIPPWEFFPDNTLF